MIEKVNPSHPDKIADRIAGAIVDLAYAAEENPKIAVEVLIGHGVCHAIIETSILIAEDKITAAIHRIAGNTIKAEIIQVAQDLHLANNQRREIRCGDNGISKECHLPQSRRHFPLLPIPFTINSHLMGNIS